MSCDSKILQFLWTLWACFWISLEKKALFLVWNSSGSVFFKVILGHHTEWNSPKIYVACRALSTWATETYWKSQKQWMWSPSFGIPSYSWNVIPNRLCSIYWVSITFNQNIQSTSSGLRFQLWQLDTTMSLQAGRKIMSISTSRSWTWSNCLGDVTLSPKDEIPWNSIKWVWNLIFPIWIDRSWDKFPSPIFLINPSQSHSHIVLACIGYIYTISYTCKQITYIYM